MSKESEDFEILTTRIHEILEKAGAIVEWNEMIPDPDNPKQLRQIDVSVRKNDVFNIIECRDRVSRQDVTWIEELMGRRMSLGADSIAAVSTSGFTKGAIRKANKNGVILYDLVSLTEVDIQNWTKGVSITLVLYRYSEFRIELTFSDRDLDGLRMDKLLEELQQFVGFRTLFTAHLNAMEDRISLPDIREGGGRVRFSAEFFIEDFYLDERQVTSVKTEGVAHLEEIVLSIPGHIAYGSPETSGPERDVYIQEYNLGKTRVIHHGEDLSISLDLSQMVLPPYWQFRFVEINGGGSHNHECFELIDPEKIIMKVDGISLSVTNNVRD